MTGSSFKTGLVSAFWLTVVVAVGWAVCFLPARMLRGDSGVWWMTIAAICCLIPGWIVVFLSMVAIVRNEFTAMAMQMLVRLFTVATVALVVRKFRPELGFVDFFGWLVGFYLLALVTEVMVLKKNSVRKKS